MTYNKVLASAVFFLGISYFGYQFIAPTDSYVFHTRGLASIPSSSSYDLSGLSAGSLKVAATKRVLSESFMRDTVEEVVIELAHFQMSLDGNLGRNACDLYTEVVMTFVAEGVAISGEKPEMTIELPCLVGDRQGYLKAFKLPKTEIVKMEMEESDDAKLLYDDLVMRFRFINDFWPKMWKLSKIKWMPQNELEAPLIMQAGDSPQNNYQSFAFQLYE